MAYVEIPAGQRQALAPMFGWTEESMAQSALEGSMGYALADDAENPRCALVGVGDFAIVAGDSASPDARSLLRGIRANRPGWPALLVPENRAWAKLAQRVYFARCWPMKRYAFARGVQFELAKLQGFVAALPQGYTLRPIEGELYYRCVKTPLTGDFCVNFTDEQDFARRGLGFAVLHGDELVGGASSYSMYSGGIEIEVDIAKAHRRRGLAAAACAQLILTCLERGLYPCWDAANTNSVALAQKLGYGQALPYKAYAILFTGK